MEGHSPVMTESERRAYRYGQAAPRQQGMRQSWSNDSLSSYVGAGSRSGARPCVCALTTHPGSFRCKHHRQNASVLIGAAALRAQVHEPSAADAGARHHEETSSANQEKRSS